MGVHGYIRATGNMDIWISQSDDNVERLLSALSDFGVPSGVGSEFFKEPGNAFRIGNPPIQIEIITEASGIHFQSSYEKRVLIETDDITIPFLGYDDLVKTSARVAAYVISPIWKASEKNLKLSRDFFWQNLSA